MESLKWEHGRAPLLRAAIVARLKDLHSKKVTSRLFRYAVGVRFRRTVTNDDSEPPPEYMYKIDVADLGEQQGLVTSVLASRRPGAEMSYDILCAQIVLPMALNLFSLSDLDSAPMCLFLLSDNDTISTLKGPANDDDELVLINRYEVFRNAKMQSVIINHNTTVKELSLDSSRQRVWTPRPPRLLASFGLRSALAMALDGEKSPCKALASYFRMWDNPRVSHGFIPPVWYESIEETMMPRPQGVKCELRVECTNKYSFAFFDRNSVVVANDTQLNAIFHSLPIELERVAVAGGKFELKQTVKIADGGMFMSVGELPGDEQMNKKIGAITAALAKMLQSVRTGSFPYIDANSDEDLQPEHAIVARDRRIPDAIFPPQVVDQLCAAIVGAWCYKFFVRGVEGKSFWVAYCHRLATKDTRRLVDLNIKATRTEEDKEVVTYSAFKSNNSFDETKSLELALSSMIIPALAVYEIYKTKK